MHSLLLMIRDLEPEQLDSKSRLSSIRLSRGLLVEGFASEPPIIADGAKFDQLFAPADSSRSSTSIGRARRTIR